MRGDHDEPAAAGALAQAMALPSASISTSAEPVRLEHVLKASARTCS